MVCIFCLNSSTKVYNSRKGTRLNSVWRRRRCKKCDAEFTTYEKADASSVILVENGKKLIPYSPTRVLLELVSVFGHIKDASEAISYVADTVEQKLYNQAAKNKTRSVTTNNIATIIAETLRHYDSTAYIAYSAKQNLLSKASLKKLTSQT